MLLGALIVGAGLWALSQSPEDDNILPLLIAGGAGVLALYILYAKGQASRQTVEAEISQNIKDPIQLEQYRRLLDDSSVLEKVRAAS